MEIGDAVKDLESMPVDEIARLLVRIEVKKRMAIREAMPPELAARVVKELHEGYVEFAGEE
jgi:hypothetical protein